MIWFDLFVTGATILLALVTAALAVVTGAVSAVLIVVGRWAGGQDLGWRTFGPVWVVAVGNATAVLALLAARWLVVTIH